MSGCITSKYPINYSNWPWKNMKTTQDFSSTSTSVVISAAASTTLALEDKVSAGTRKPGRRASRGGPVGWNLWDLARTTLTKSKTSGFWSKLLSKFQLVPLLQHSTRKKFSPGTVFWPREIVAKGHSHPWAIPWFCTPMVYPPQALRGHRSRSGLLKRQWTGGLPENAFISPLLFDPQKKTLHSTLLSRAFAYRLSNWTPMDGGRFQWPALYGFKQLPLTWSQPWQNTFLYAPCTWSLSKTTSVTGGWLT